MRPAIRFALLGPVRAWRDGAGLDLGPPQQRLLLAVLLAHAGGPVTLDALVDLLWERDPPSSAVNVVHRYVGALRRVFEPDLPARASGSWLVRDGGSYRLLVDADSCDLVDFQERTKRARQVDDPRAAVAEYTAALALWDSRVADGIVAPPRARSIFLELDHQGCVVVCEATDLALQCGLAADLVAYLRLAAALDELNEAIQARLMLALAASGNQAAALRTFEAIRARLADELGVDPGVELTAAFRQVLVPQPTEPLAVAPVVRPAQLPPDLPTFAGRHEELAYLESVLAKPKGLVTVAIDGMPGSGKTTLAVHWAHSVADRFPDGQLYVNMRGFDPNFVLTPAEALRGFLDALGIHPNRIPSTLDAQAALYRSLLSDRRVLVLIDNVRDIGDVEPLLPGAAGCHVVVTSRNRLAGLVAGTGAVSMTLSEMSTEDAREALVLRLGKEKVEAEPAAVEEIIALCGGLPLALAIVAARAAAHPNFPLRAIIEKLSQAKGLGDDSCELDVYTAFSWSYRILTAPAARLFRLLSLHIGADTSTEAAASLAALPPRRAHALLDELTRTRFLTEHEPGRFIAHELIKSYAIQQRDQFDSPEEQHRALGRLLDYYLHTSYAAYLLMHPHQIADPPEPARPGVSKKDIPDFKAALAWCTTERVVIGLLVKQAAENGFPRYAWTLAITMQPYYQRGGFIHDWLETMTTALAAAVEAGDQAGQALMHRSVAGAHFQLGQIDASLEHLRQTERLFTELGYTTEFAYLYSNLSTVMSRLGRPEEALVLDKRALPLYELAGDQKGQAIALHAIASCSSELGRHDEAIALATQAMDIYQRIDDRHGQGTSWENLGEIHAKHGDHEQAARCFQVAVDVYREVGAYAEAADSLVALGDALNAEAATAQAMAAWQSALAIFEELRLPVSAEVRARLSAHADST